LQKEKEKRLAKKTKESIFVVIKKRILAALLTFQSTKQ